MIYVEKKEIKKYALSESLFEITTNLKGKKTTFFKVQNIELYGAPGRS